MDFKGNNQRGQFAPAQAVSRSTESPVSKISKTPVNKLFKSASIVLLFGLTGLAIALTFLLSTGGNSQLRAVQKERYQAVFLNNGQVYFGNIKGLDNQTVDLRNIYYLQTSSGEATSTTAAANSNVSLVKLGCELHAPFDQMMINKDQVIFWENLQDSSQVVKAIEDYKKQNSTQNCSTTSQNSTQQAPSTPTPAPTTATPTPAPATRRP